MHKINFDNSEYYFKVPFNGYFYTRGDKLLSNTQLENKGIYEKLVNRVHKEIQSMTKLKSIPESISEYIVINNVKPTPETCKSLLSQLKTNYTHLSIANIADKIVSLNLADYSYNIIKVKTERKLAPMQKYMLEKQKNIFVLRVPKCHSYKLINQLVNLDKTVTYEIE